MWIEIGYTHSKLVRCTDDERGWLSEYLSFSDANGRFNGRGADAKIHMLNPFNRSFPTGYIPLLEKRAPEDGFEIQFSDVRKRPCTQDATADLSWLRDYQLRGVQIAIDKTRGILWCPTGSGKTEIAIGLSLALPCKWLLLVHRSSLMEQAAARYELRTHRQAGRIGEGMWNVPDDCNFISATFQTMSAKIQRKDARALELLGNVQGLLCDELHVLPAQSFWAVAMACPAYYRFGMSGTPLARGDKRSVFSIAATGPVIYRIRTESLINMGVLAKPRVHMIEMQHSVPQKDAWQAVYRASVVQNKQRNAVLLQIIKRAAHPGFVFFKEIAHGHMIEKMLWQYGIKTAFVHGKHSTAERMRLVRDLVAGRLNVLLCSVVFQEGLDVPELRSIVNASGGLSIIGQLQKIGRGMRVHRDQAGNVLPGGNEFEVWDIADYGCGCTKQHAGDDPLQRPHSGCVWLEKHTRARLHTYTQEGYETIVEQMVV